MAIFPYFMYLMKISLHRGWMVLKSLKTPLRNIKMAPNPKNVRTTFISLTSIMKKNDKVSTITIKH